MPGLCYDFVAGMEGQSVLREFVRDVLKKGHSENDLDKIMVVLTNNRVKVALLFVGCCMCHGCWFPVSL